MSKNELKVISVELEAQLHYRLQAPNESRRQKRPRIGAQFEDL